ncbi:hypothetical protein [Mesorhizobium sp. M0243]|uniref:hypothetical protein n=1 Tax=unclassified Mesorhizobium TaxID=325217 RepID=UPI00333A97CC
MSDQTPGLRKSFVGDESTDEVFGWLDQALDDNAQRLPIGIRMSNSLFKMAGKPDEYRGVKIAMDPDLYPDATVSIVFE